MSGLSHKLISVPESFATSLNVYKPAQTKSGLDTYPDSEIEYLNGKGSKLFIDFLSRALHIVSLTNIPSDPSDPMRRSSPMKVASEGDISQFVQVGVHSIPIGEPIPSLDRRVRNTTPPTERRNDGIEVISTFQRSLDEELLDEYTDSQKLTTWQDEKHVWLTRCGVFAHQLGRPEPSQMGALITAAESVLDI
jgi:hypothetical protein